MTNIAIDIVLLPPQDIMDKAIHTSQNIVHSADERLILNQHEYIPHITLAMGCVDEKDIVRIAKDMDKLVQKQKTLYLTISKTVVSEKNQFVGFSISPTPELQQLHVDTFNILTPYLTNDATPDSFIGDVISESAPIWANTFHQTSTLENYKPHITLGYGNPKKTYENINFLADRIALRQMGTHCTFRKILHETKLQ